MKSLELTLARVGLLATFLLLLACGGLFGDDDNRQTYYTANVAARMENNDPVLPVHMWLETGSMTDQNRIEAGQSRSETQSRLFTEPSFPIQITIHAQRPDTALQTASVNITYSQALAGNRVVAHWTSAGGLTAEVVPPNNG